ncbi:hypothetical protein FBU30_001793 [Linnemannia zychae]|nr:hypothetical protein FBU30_001793 [Linnemannia zychae]
MRYLLRQKLVIHMWGAGACLVALLAWKMVSEIEPTSALLILKLQAPEVVAELAKMPFERLYLLYCWTTIVVAWYVYAIVISILMRTSTVLKYLGESGEGSAGAGINSQEFDNRADMIVETNEELEQKEQRGIRDQEQLEQKHCGNADSNENGHDMEERAQRSVAKVSSLRTKCQPISCQQYLGQPSHKKDTNPTTVAAIKRYRGGPPTNTQKPREISTALLQQVRHEIQIWSLSLWILAPNVPRSFSQQHPQHPQDYSSVNKRDSSTGTRCQARHPQLYSPLDKQDVGNVVLSTASSSVHKMEIDEPEYELVQCEEVLESELTSSMATSTKSQLELETEPGRRRSLDGSDGGNQDPVQDDGKLRGQRIPPLTESQPIKQQPQRSAFMSQSLPDLHAVKRTGPSSIESTLARWSRRALNPDRLGSIFQNYLKRHVSTSRKDRFPSEYDSDVHDYTANDGPLDEGNNQCSDDTEEEEDGPGVAFVIRSSTLPTVRVGLYNADLKRLWTSSGSIHLLPSPEESIAAHSTERGGE